MSTASTIQAINNDTIAYAPAVIAGIQAAEATGSITGATGPQKAQAVIDGVLAGSQALENSKNANVAGIAALVDLFVSIFNSLGVFKHKTA